MLEHIALRRLTFAAAFAVFLGMGLAAWCPAQTLPPPGTVLYVDVDNPTPGDGQSWASALNSLSVALELASDDKVEMIWVAEGSYLPEIPPSGNPRFAHFFVLPGRSILGGFAGNELSAAQRNPVVHVTTLSGDIGVSGDPTDNCYNVIRNEFGTSSLAVLDGFTISGGNAPPLHSSLTRRKPRH